VNEEEARRLSLETMSMAEAAFLSTIDSEGFPHTRAMVNLRNREKYGGLADLFSDHEDDFLVCFSTLTSSNKVRQLRTDPRASVYYCLPSQWRGLVLRGEIEIVADQAFKESIWQDGWEIYYPGGPTDPEYTILRLFPKDAEYYHALQTAEITFRRAE